MLQNDSHLNCLCVMARLIEALAIYLLNLMIAFTVYLADEDVNKTSTQRRGTHYNH